MYTRSAQILVLFPRMRKTRNFCRKAEQITMHAEEHTAMERTPLRMIRTTSTILLLAFGVGHIPLSATIDAIFFISVSPEYQIALSECHISFWTLGNSREVCRDGCSALGSARLGLNTFETSTAIHKTCGFRAFNSFIAFRRKGEGLTYLLTLVCPSASVTTDPCASVEYPLFSHRGSVVVLKPTNTPVNLGRFIVGLQR